MTLLVGSCGLADTGVVAKFGGRDENNQSVCRNVIHVCNGSLELRAIRSKFENEWTIRLAIDLEGLSHDIPGAEPRIREIEVLRRYGPNAILAFRGMNEIERPTGFHEDRSIGARGGRERPWLSVLGNKDRKKS